MTTQKAAQEIEIRGYRRRGLLTSVTLGAAALALLAAVAVGPAEAREKAAAGTGKIVFASDRTTGPGVVNPQGDYEIFIMNPDGTNPKQLTRNAALDYNAMLSPNGQKVTYQSNGKQSSNPEGDTEVYMVNADGSDGKNLTNNGADVFDDSPAYSPDGRKIAYESNGPQSSNSQGDSEIYLLNANGSGKKNLTNNEASVHDYDPAFSPDSKIAFTSQGVQTSNPEGDHDIYTMNADGSSPSNFTNISGAGVNDYDPSFSPDGQKIVFSSTGVQTSNPEGDFEVYVRNTSGLNEINLSNNAADVNDREPVFSPDGQKIAFRSAGIQTSNPEGDNEVYTVNGNGSGKRNLTNNGEEVDDFSPDYASDGKRLNYYSYGKQTSNPQGDYEVYRMNASGLGQVNLTNNTASDAVD